MDLEHFLATMQGIEANNNRLRIDGLCKSLGGNNCYVLTITNNLKDLPSSEEDIERYQKFEYPVKEKKEP